MSLDKEYLRKKVVQGIEKMPYDVSIYRAVLDDYKEVNGYEKVTDLTGVLYKSNNYSKNNTSLANNGEISEEETKKFLVDFNDKSVKVKKGDYLFYKNKCYKVNSLGEDFEVFFEMVVEEHEWFEV